MSFSNSVVRRYTPPTCTLEINAAGSPLSRWIGRPAFKQLEFQLSLDDPRLPEDKRLTLKGDKTQLEALREAVETYVQDLLVQSPDISPTLLAAATENADELPAEAVSDAANDETIAVSPTNSEDAQSIESVEAEQVASPPTSLSALPGNIYLQPDGMLAHHLYLGSLATPESGQVVSLSTLQLFDLATAFEQYAEELVALPHLKREQKKGFATRLKTTPVWARTATVLALAGGATAAGLLFVNRNTLIQTADAPPASPTPNPTEQPPIAVIPSPSPTLVVPTPPLSSSQILPSPTVGTGASPSPNTLPSVLPGVTPGSTPFPNLGAGVTPGSTPSPNLGNNTPSSRSGVPAAPSPNASPSVPSGGATAGRSPGESYKVPGLQFGTRGSTTGTTPPPTPSPQQRNDVTQRSPRRVPSGESRPSPSPAATSTPDSVATRPNRAVQRNEPRAARSTPPANPSFFPRPDVTPKATTSPARGPAPIPAPTIVRPAAIPTPRFETPTPIPTPAAATPTAIPTPMAAAPAQIPRPTATATIPDPTVAALRQTPTPAPEVNSTPAATPDRDSTSAVFDQNPQVAQVERYFQQRWQPPSTLTQDIEYTLSLNPDGSIKSVTPRGQTAEIYLDRTEMPLVGEPFVSPIEGGRNTTIILVLSKDGKVRAFPGSSN